MTTRAIGALTDRFWRTAYRVAFRAARLWWRLRRPAHDGAVAAVWLRGRVLTIRQSYRSNSCWPGGGIRGGEEPREAARRELREEAGIEAEAWTDLGVVDQLTEVVVSPNRLFLARQLTFVRPEREGSERIRTVKVPMAEAVRWVMDGTISHAASATLVLKAERILGVGRLEHHGVHDG